MVRRILLILTLTLASLGFTPSTAAAVDIADYKVIDGRREISKWIRVGDIRAAAYKRMPVTDGHGIRFTQGQNCLKKRCKYSDQVWSGSRLLRQVVKKRNIRPGFFWVGEGKVWLHKSDTRARVKVSDRRSYGFVTGTLENVRLVGFSPTPADGAVILLHGGTLRNVIIEDSSTMAVRVTGVGSQMENVLIKRSGWMGVGAVKCSHFTMRDVRIENINTHRDFATTPQSGGLKTSRCRNIEMENVAMTQVDGHGAWFDQSTVDVHVNNLRTSRINGRALFFEISHGLYLENSVLWSTRATKFAGASGVRIGRTFFSQPYITPTDRRNCPDPKTPLCSGTLSSDRLSPYDSRITWRNDVVHVD